MQFYTSAGIALTALALAAATPNASPQGEVMTLPCGGDEDGTAEEDICGTGMVSSGFPNAATLASRLALIDLRTKLIGAAGVSASCNISACPPGDGCDPNVNVTFDILDVNQGTPMDDGTTVSVESCLTTMSDWTVSCDDCGS